MAKDQKHKTPHGHDDKAKASVDEELKETFPASDPPSYSGGAVGAPKRKKDGADKPDKDE